VYQRDPVVIERKIKLLGMITLSPLTALPSTGGSLRAEKQGIREAQCCSFITQLMGKIRHEIERQLIENDTFLH